MAASDITGLHHIGLVVRDLRQAIATYRRLGFHIAPPSYPALPPTPGAAPEPIGAGNTHADFRRNFIELLATAPDDRDRLPAGSVLVPLEIPDDKLEATKAAIEHTIAGLTSRLDRFEGAHILIFSSDDAEKTAARLDASVVGHTGALAAQRPITTAEGTSLEAIKYLEIRHDDPVAAGGMPPEGRIGVTEDAPPAILDARTGLDHPNGAVALVEGVLCVSEDDLDAVADRYASYLGVAARDDGAVRGFDFNGSRLTVTTPSELAAWLPGEQPPGIPALSACVVAVADLAAAEDYLLRQGVDTRTTSAGEPFIPAAAAHGTAIVLRQAGATASG